MICLKGMGEIIPTTRRPNTESFLRKFRQVQSEVQVGSSISQLQTKQVCQLLLTSLIIRSILPQIKFAWMRGGYGPQT